MTRSRTKMRGGNVAASMTMTAWLAPAIEVDGPGGRRVHCDWTRPGDELEAITGIVGHGAAIVVRYAKGDYDAAAAIVIRLRGVGYTNVRTERTRR